MGEPEPVGRKRAVVAIGAALVFLGIVVVAGWVLRLPALVQVLPGLKPMVLNTAICFVLCGAWLAIATLRPDWRRAARTIATGVLALAAAATLQYAVDFDLGIDFAALHRWLPTDDPGRLSALTGLAFIAASVTMLLAAMPARRGRDALALMLATVPGLVGTLAIVGYLFELHLVYGRYPLGLVALHTAAGLIALTVALWLWLLKEQRVHFWKRLATQDRITFASAAILSLISLAVAVGVFAVWEDRTTQALSDVLATSLRYRAMLAETAIDGGLQRTRILVGRPAPARALRMHLTRPDDAEAIAQLSQSAASLVADGYIAAVYYDTRGRAIASAGRPVRAPPLDIALRGVPGATLAWDEHVLVSGRYRIADAEGTVGEALVQAPLPALEALLRDTYRFGATGESALCGEIGERLGCFPQPHVPKVHFVPAKTPDGTVLPMSRGLAGEIGVSLTRDFRGERVMAAYGPIGGYGLAMVVKMDTAEFYAPVRERLQFVLPLLAVLIFGGTLLLRTGVQPLAARLAQSEREAQARHRALDAMMANVADGMMRLDADGTIRSWNAAAERLFGYGAGEAIGRNVAMLVPDALREGDAGAASRFLAPAEDKDTARADLHYPARRKDGSPFEIEITVTRMGGEAPPQLVAVFRDITERKETERRLTQLAFHDALTGLPNRANFKQRLEEAFARRRRSGEQLAVLFMDLDYFKHVNDTLGHEAGDALLIAFGKRLHGALRESDMVARLGGDEFTIVAEGLKGEEDAFAIADKILAAMREPLDVDGRPIATTTSIGIALHRDGDTPQTLMKRADTALYEAKGAGRARYCVAQ
jgi:diguanylate cyclase (GGDEF)-like protein/PAS domain S-box-containing protein